MSDSIQNKRSIVASAPGKVILFGEHAVVYGKKAMAASIDLRTYASLRFLPADTPAALVVDLLDVNVHVSVARTAVSALRPPHDARPTLDPVLCDALAAALSPPPPSRAVLAAAYLYLVSPLRDPVHVRVRATLPVGSGLGSSASLSAVLAALFLGPTTAKPTLNHHAYLAECILLHGGQPSGIDNTIVTMGGALVYDKTSTDAFQPIHLDRPIPCLLVHTHVAKETATMVRRVRALYERSPQVIGAMFETIHTITEHARTSGVAVWTECIAWNQRLLESLDVSHPRIDDIVRLARTHGAVAKLVGAGGGGCVWVYAADGDYTRFVRALPPSFTAYPTTLGAHGVQVAAVDDDGDGVSETTDLVQWWKQVYPEEKE